MTLRNASAKFSLPSFGRKNNSSSSPTDGSAGPSSRIPSDSYGSQPQTTSVYSGGSGGYDDSLHSGGGGGGGGGSAALDGFGRKIGKSIAHTRLLPSLGNQDLRMLQDVISAEKGVLSSAERLAVDMQTAASRLPVYGQQEGPDLQDVLNHSSTLLSQLSVAMRTFAQHEASMRACFKRIREREEQLDELRRRRRTTGQKAETAERKLAKMGPENKQLVQQTELLEQLRNQMRQLDSDIVNEEAKNGDFKRQAVKEAMSFKFGGLEELGEKMCIVGELGKLLLEEIPLEETPPGYGRAPYQSHDRTENTVSEAVKCLATVQFQASSAAPKPPGLPRLSDATPLQAPNIPRHNSHTLADHEEFEHLPGNPQSPASSKAPQLPPVSDLAYAGMDQSPPTGQPRKFSAVSAEILPPRKSSVVWNAPTNDVELSIPDYEFEQQRQMDAEREPAERASSMSDPSSTSPRSSLGPAPPVSSTPPPTQPQPGWQPLRVTNDVGGLSLHDGPAPRGTTLSDGPPRGTTLSDGPVRGTTLSDGPPRSHDGSVDSMTLALNRDAFTPLGESFMSGDDLQPPQRPTSGGSGYYTAEEDRNATSIQSRMAPAISLPADHPMSSEMATPTQVTANLPPEMRSTLPRPASGYIPPVAPPVANLGESEEFSAPVSVEREGYYNNSYNSRVSSSTFNVPRDVRASGGTFLSNASVPDSINSDMSHPRDSFQTLDSRPRDSYQTFHTRHSSDGEDAVVVTIPAEPMPLRSATPTMVTTNGGVPRTPSGPTVGVMSGDGSGRPTISAAAFRRGARRRSMTEDSDTHSSFGHLPEIDTARGPRRLPSPPAASELRRIPNSPPPGYEQDSLR